MTGQPAGCAPVRRHQRFFRDRPGDAAGMHLVAAFWIANEGQGAGFVGADGTACGIADQDHALRTNAVVDDLEAIENSQRPGFFRPFSVRVERAYLVDVILGFQASVADQGGKVAMAITARPRS